MAANVTLSISSSVYAISYAWVNGNGVRTPATGLTVAYQTLTLYNCDHVYIQRVTPEDGYGIPIKVAGVSYSTTDPQVTLYPSGTSTYGISATSTSVSYAVSFDFYDADTSQLLKSHTEDYEQGTGVRPWNKATSIGLPSGYDTVVSIWRYVWSTGSYTQVSQGTTITINAVQNFEIYVSKSAPSYYTLSAVAKTGISSATVSPTLATAGGSATWTATLRSGYQFYYWSTDAAGYSIYSYNRITTVDNIQSNLTLYAWGRLVTYDVVLRKGSHVSTVSATDYNPYEGDIVTFSATFETGYECAYWYDNNTGEIVSYNATFSQYIYDDVDYTCYAQVAQYSCQAIAADDGFQSVAASPSVVAYGGSCTFSAVLKSGYTFVAWTDASGETVYSQDRIYTVDIYRDRTIYAHSRRSSCTV